VWPDASQGRCPASLEIGQSLFEQLVEPTGLDVGFNCLIETVSFQPREPVTEAREIALSRRSTARSISSTFVMRPL
jgi:hypothetical protein